MLKYKLYTCKTYMHNNNNLHTTPLYVSNKVNAFLYIHADTHFGTQTEKTWNITPEK